MNWTVLTVAQLLVAVAPRNVGVVEVLYLSEAQARAGGQPPSQWGALTPGPHGVGFRLAPQIDHSRRVAPRVDFEGKPNRGPGSMAMRVAVWYPTARAQSAPAMQFGTFAALGAKQDLTPVTPADRAAALASRRSFAGFAFGRQISDAAMAATDTTSTSAVLDAAPAPGPFPVILAATDGSVAAATVLFEYLASNGFVVLAVPTQPTYGTLQVSRPAAVVNARVRDLEFLLDHARQYRFADTARVAVLGVNFDGMSALAFQMKNMAARAVVSIDGWEGKPNGVETLRSDFNYDPRRLRVPYFVVLQDEPQSPPGFGLDRTIFDAMRYSDRQWLVLTGMSHAYLIANPLTYPDVPAEKRAAYEYLVRATHRFLAAAVGDSSRPDADAGTSSLVKDAARVRALPAVPDDAELERLIMVDRAADKVATILRTARAVDSSFVLFPQQTMSLYAFRFARRNDAAYALRLLELNAEAFPRSWSASDAVADAYRDAGDTTKAVASYTRALDLIARLPVTESATDSATASQARASIDQKIGPLRRP